MRDVVHINLDDVVILLEDGPHSTGQLAAWLQVSVPTVLSALKRLRRAGRVRVVGVRKLWELTPAPGASPASVTTTQAPASPSGSAAAGPDVVEAADPDPLAFDEELDASDPDADLADEFLAPARRGPGRPKNLRQPSAAAASSAKGPAWWVGLDRAAHNSHATQFASQMSATKEAASISSVRGIAR